MKKKLFAVLLAVMMVLGLFAGCAAKESVSNTSKYDDYYLSTDGSSVAPSAPGAPNYGFDGDMADKMENTAGAENDSASGAMIPYDPSTTAEKIIYSATVNMETLQFEDTVSALEAAVMSIGGFIESSNVSGDTSYDSDGKVQILNRKAFYTVRIPAQKFNEFLAYSGTLGNIISSNKNADNVTSQYTDYEARLTSLKTEETRLLELLAKATDIDALIALNNRLSEVRYDIEAIERNLKNLDSRIAYSSVSFTIREVRVYQSRVPVQRSFWERIGDSFTGGWDDFVEGVEDFCVGFVGAIFPLTIVAVLAVVAIILIRKSVKTRKAKKKDAGDE